MAYEYLIGKRINIETEGSVLNSFKIIDMEKDKVKDYLYFCRTEVKTPLAGYDSTIKLLSTKILNNLVSFGISEPPKNKYFRRPITYRLID